MYICNQLLAKHVRDIPSICGFSAASVTTLFATVLQLLSVVSSLVSSENSEWNADSPALNSDSWQTHATLHLFCHKSQSKCTDVFAVPF